MRSASQSALFHPSVARHAARSFCRCAWRVPLLMLAFAGPACSAVTGQLPQSTRVEEIRLDPQAHVNEIRTVEGVVDRLVNRPGGDSPAFYLEDDFGHLILVLPFATAPRRGDRLVVTGVVTLDDAGDPVLTVFNATGVQASTPTQAGDAEASPGGPAAEATPGGAATESSTTTVTLPRRRPDPTAIAVGVGLLLSIGFLLSRRGRGTAKEDRPIITGQTASHEVDIATSALWPESEQEFDGRTMRFSRPDPTMQLMPVRLEVIGGGDAGEVIHFVGVPGAPIEMMLGRSPGLGPSNVQLKQKTVSRTHAVIRHRHDEWLIENLSMTNPTVLNEEVLGVQERLLTDGDRIEMGEVVFRFKAS